MKINITTFLFNVILVLHSLIAFSQNSKVSGLVHDSKIYTSDIQNFYNAFDLAINDETKAKKIFKKEYFSKGTKGLKDFYNIKIEDYDKFAKFVIKHKSFYASIRKDISNIEDLKKQIYTYFENFKNLYPNAVFPDIYFLIGRFSSNGTISKRGLLIGTEILSRTDSTNTENWNKNILKISMLRRHIPVTVSHELVHFNQSKIQDDDQSLLAKCMKEGSAEFIAELIAGSTDGDYSEFKGRELELWNLFKNDKDKSVWETWSTWQKSNNHSPRNAGYWAGYMICKAYSEKLKNDTKAVEDILSIQNYSDFYKNSEVDNYMIETYGN